MWIILSGSVRVFAIDDWMFWKMTYWSHGEDYVPTTQRLPLPLGSTTIASKEIAAASAAIWTLSCQHKSRSESNRFLMMSIPAKHGYRFHGSQTRAWVTCLHHFKRFLEKTCIVLHDIFSTVHSLSSGVFGMKKAGTCPDSSGFIVHGYIWMHNFHDDESTSRRTSLGRGNDHRFPPHPCTPISLWINWNVIFPVLRNYYQAWRWQEYTPSHIFLHPSDVPACSVSVMLATTDTQSCLLDCSCPNACHAKKNDSGVLVLVFADWKYHCGQTRQQNILYIPRSSKRC